MGWTALAWVLVLGDIGAGRDSVAPRDAARPDVGPLGMEVDGLARQTFQRAATPEEIRGTRWLLQTSPGDALSDYRHWLMHRSLADRVRQKHTAVTGGEMPLHHLIPVLRASIEALEDDAMIAGIVRRAAGLGPRGVARIRGRVLDARTGEALPGTELFAMGDIVGASAVAADEGIFEIGQVPWRLNGSLSLYGSRPGYALAIEQLSPGRSDGDGTIDIVIRLGPGSALTGAVTDPGGMPVPEARVVTASFGTAADSQGGFLLSGLDPLRDPLEISVHHPGFRQRLARAPVPGAGEAARLHIILEPGLRIGGTVTGGDGRPIAFARVSRFVSGRVDSSEWVLSDSQGRFAMRRCEPGSWVVLAESPGLAPAWTEVELGGDRESVSLDLRLEPGASFSGRVAGPAGETVAGAVVGWMRFENGPYLSRYTITDDDGAFSFRGLPPVPLEFRVNEFHPGTRTASAGWSPGESHIEITADEPPELRGRIAGRVVDAATGAPVESFQVQLRFPWLCAEEHPAPAKIPEGYRWIDIRDGNGVFRLPATPEMGYAVLVRAAGYAIPRICMGASIGPGAPTTIRLAMEVPLHGRVIGAGGTPVRGARVVLCDAEDDLRVHGRYDREAFRDVTDADGRFTIPNRAGDEECFLIVSSPGHALTPVGPVRPSATSAADPLQVFLHTPATLVVRAPDGSAGETGIAGLYRAIAASANGHPFDFLETRGTMAGSTIVGFRALAPGTYLAFAREPQPGPASPPFRFAMVDVSPGADLEIDLQEPGITVSGAIAGLPLPRQSGMPIELTPAHWPEPLPDNVVRLRTDDNGRFAAPNLSPGRWIARVSRLLFTDAGELRHANARHEFDVQAGRTQVDIAVPLSFSPLLARGNPAPGFELIGLDARRHSLADFRGRWVVLNFWATTSAPCLDQLPLLKEAAARFAGEETVFVNVALDHGLRRIRELTMEGSLSGLQLRIEGGSMDDTVRAYQVTAVPALFLIDPEGRIAGSHLQARVLSSVLETVMNRPQDADALLAFLSEQSRLFQEVQALVETEPDEARARLLRFYETLHPDARKPDFYDALLRRLEGETAPGEEP